MGQRIRTIKPDFFTHEGLADLSVAHRVLFIGLWTLADRRGRMMDRARRIKVACFPYDDDITAEGVNAMLDDLANHRDAFVVRYQCRGRDYLEIPGFLEHQRPHHKEVESTLPGSSSKDCVIVAPIKEPSTPTSMGHARSMDESSMDHARVNDERGREGKGTGREGNGRERKGMEGKGNNNARPEEIFALRSHES